MEICVFNEQDFIFLPGNIYNNSSSDYALIYYYNADADDGNGCFEKGRLWKDNILFLDKQVKHNATDFFDKLWETLNVSNSWGIYRDNAEFFETVKSFENADFIFGLDGNYEDELSFLLNWAKA